MALSPAIIVLVILSTREEIGRNFTIVVTFRGAAMTSFKARKHFMPINWLHIQCAAG